MTTENRLMPSSAIWNRWPPRGLRHRLRRSCHFRCQSRKSLSSLLASELRSVCLDVLPRGGQESIGVAFGRKVAKVIGLELPPTRPSGIVGQELLQHYVEVAQIRAQ